MRLQIFNSVFRYGFLLVVLLSSGCVKPFEVEAPSNGGLLVVEGSVKDKKGETAVELSFSSPVGTNNIVPAIGAMLEIEDNEGTVHQLTESESGIYVPLEDDFVGKVGNSYKLRILLNENEYESDWTTIKSTPEIDDVYFDVVEKETVDRDVNIGGVEIYVDTKDVTNNARYYKWDMVETWSYSVPFPAVWEYLGDNELRRKADEDIGDICYKSAKVSNITVATSAQFSEDVISKQPILFINENSGKLNIEYSILVRQSAIQEDEFLFLDQLNRSTSGGGDLYELQPDPLLGNMSNITEESVPVLGYFSATSTTEKRIFINSGALPLSFPISNCKLDTVNYSPFEDKGFSRPTLNHLFFNMEFIPGAEIPSSYLFVPLSCGDCRALGGTNIKPDFWP